MNATRTAAFAMATLLHAALPVAAQDELAQRMESLIATSCGSCHRPGGAGPFAIQTPADIRRRAAMIASVVESGLMPPWLPDAPDQPSHRLTGDRRLSDQERTDLLSWIKAGAPDHGDPSEVTEPSSAAFDFATWRPTWSLGDPDFVLRLPGTFTVPAELGEDSVRGFVLPIKLPEDVYVRAIELVPSNPRVVHHASMLIDGSGAARRLQAQSERVRQAERERGGQVIDPAATSDVQGFPAMGALGNQFMGSAGGWSPGAPVVQLPPGYGMQLPSDCDFVVECHFKASGKPEPVTFAIGLHFAGREDRVERDVHTLSMGNLCIDLPAGARNVVVEDSMTLPIETLIIGLAPHAHYLCRSLHVIAEIPECPPAILLAIGDWNFDFLQQYRFADPVRLPAGTVLRYRCVYDNTTENPRNPTNPPQPVQSGHRLTDEMALLLLHVSAVDPTRIDRLLKADEQHLRDRLEAYQQWKDARR